MSTDETDKWMDQGKIVFKNGHYEESLIFFEKVIAYNPSDVDAYNEKGKAFDHLERYEGAIVAFDKAIEFAPESAKFYVNKALMLFKLERNAEALPLFEQALQLDSSLGWVYHYTGHLLLQFHRNEEALIAYERAVALDPNSTEIRHGYANALRRLERFDEALQAYDQAIQRDPHYFRSYSGACSLLYQLGRYQEALILNDQALALDPQLAEFQNGRGDILLKLDRLEEALIAYDRAIHVDPHFMYSYNGKGLVLQKLGRYQEALEAYEQAITLDPTFPSAWKNKGGVLFQLGRSTESREAYIQAHKLQLRQSQRVQIHFRAAENQSRWVWTDGLQTLGQREIAVMVPWRERDSHDRLITDLLRFVENSLSDQSKRILPRQTMHYGWTTLRFVQDKHNLSGAGTEVLLIEELEHPFSLDDPSFVPGVAHTIALMQLQKEALQRNHIAGDVIYPHRSQFALVCKRVTPETVQLLRPLMAHRAWQPEAQDSGWFLGCCRNDHDHNNSAELAKMHLIHLVKNFPGLFPYLVMPVDTKLVFETSQVIVFGPGKQDGQVDSGDLLSSLPEKQPG